MTTRLDFTAIPPGQRLVPVVLVAGVPVVLVPAGLHPTTTVCSSGSLDLAWWPGTGSLLQDMPGALADLDPVKGWLDPAQEFTVETVSKLVQGDCEQGALSFDLLDVDGAVTAALSSRDGLTSQLLASEVDASAWAIPLQFSSDFPAEGWVSIGRESVIYSSIAGGALVVGVSPDRRGAFGSRAVVHPCPAHHPPVVSLNGVRSWHGRRLSLWLAALSADGTTLTDPTLLFLGVVGRGVQLTSDLTRWRIPADGIVEALSQKVAARSVTLYGIAHHEGQAGRADGALDLEIQGDSPNWDRTPLAAAWDGPIGNARGRVALVGADAAYHNAGWHRDWPSFIGDWNARSEAFSQAEYSHEREAWATRNPDGRITVAAAESSLASCAMEVAWAWDTTPRPNQLKNESGYHVEITSQTPAPEAWVPLDGRIYVPDSEDFGNIPSTLYSGTSPDLARWALTFESEGVPQTVVLATRDAVTQTVTGIVDYAGASRSVLGGLPTVSIGNFVRVLRARTTLSLAVYVDASRWDLGLREACRLMDALGGDWHEDSVDWDTIADEVRRGVTPGIPQGRSYAILPGDDSLLDRIAQECRLAGLSLCVRHGRLSVYRPGDVASSESTSSTITAADVCREDGISVVDATEDLASSVLFELPDGSKVSWVDETYRADYGDGATIEVRVIDGPTPADRGALLASLRRTAWAILGPVAQPWREITLALPLPWFDLAPGDLLSVTHPQVPTWTGTRGLTSAVCQVSSVSLRLCGGRARAVVRARLATGVPRGYAPAALVAAGGITGADVTLDTLSAWGAAGFAYNGALDGGASAFAVGDAVVLTEIDCSSVSTPDEGFTVASVSGAVVTLSGSPSAAMAALAASQYKVALRTDYWATATAAQKLRSAYMADDSDGLLGAADSPHRWSA